MENENEENLDVKIPAVSETLEAIRDVKTYTKPEQGTSQLCHKL
jgi:uncharacterized protein YfkK (UPF0435 family)